MKGVKSFRSHQRANAQTSIFSPSSLFTILVFAIWPLFIFYLTYSSSSSTSSSSTSFSSSLHTLTALLPHASSNPVTIVITCSFLLPADTTDCVSRFLSPTTGLSPSLFSSSVLKHVVFVLDIGVDTSIPDNISVEPWQLKKTSILASDPEARGVSASRNAAYNQMSKLFPPPYDPILLFVRPDVVPSSLTTRILREVQYSLTTEKLQNTPIRAVSTSFNVLTKNDITKELSTLVPTPGLVLTLTPDKLTPIWSQTSMNSYISASLPYPSPLLSSPVNAILSSTFSSLPSNSNANIVSSVSTNHAQSDVDISLALWLCGSGIDVLPTVTVSVDPSFFLHHKPLKYFNDETVIPGFISAYVKNEAVDLEGVDSSVKSAILESLRKKTGKGREGGDDMCKSFGGFKKDVLALAEEKLTEKVKNLAPKTIPIPVPVPLTLPTPPVPPALSKPHPHAGALDELGAPNYRHNEKALRTAPPPFKLSEDDTDCRKGGQLRLGDADFKMVDSKIGHVKVTAQQPDNKVRLFCTVYTHKAGHESAIPSIRSTWGPKCDGFLAASTETDKNLNIVNIPHEGPEEYNNIWQKIRSIWSYVHDNYYEDYDYFFIGGDDVYMIVENLRLYLGSNEMKEATEDGSKPIFLGRRFLEGGKKERLFNSGGAGYIFNKASLKLLMSEMETCRPHLHGFFEDVMSAECLRKHDVHAYDTRDKLGREIFHPFQPGHHFTYASPKVHPEQDWYTLYTMDLKFGYECCSEESATFHYVKPKLMNRLHALLYGYCP